MIDSVARLQRARKNGEDEGFTLIELLVVVVIIGILIAIAVPLYLNYRRGANDKAAQSDLRAAVSSLEQCMADNSAYPTGVTTAGVYTGCAGQTGSNASDNTTLTYSVNNATTPTAYTLYSKNSGGTKTYCYTSTKGGQVKASGTATSTYADSCAAVTP